MNTLYSTKDIASQGKGFLLDGGVLVKLDILTNTVTSTYGITSNQSYKLPSGHSANIPAQSSAKVSAGQSAKFYAGLKYETLSCPNPDIPNRGEITPFKGFIGVTTRGGIEFFESIKKDCVEFCEPIKSDRCVEFSESIKKGSIPATRFVQPLGSMPRLCSSARPNSFNQLARLTPSFCASKSNCSFRSGVMRIWNGGAFPVPFGCLSRLMTVDMCTPINVVLFPIGVHTSMYVPIKTTPRCAETLPRRLTTNDIISIEVAMSKHITPVTGRNSLTPNQSFRWLFLALERGNPAAKPHRIEATAPNEHSARLLLVRDYILAFAGRLPVREVTA